MSKISSTVFFLPLVNPPHALECAWKLARNHLLPPFACCSPPFTNCSPPFATCSPPFATCSPPFATCSPPFATCSPPFASCSPPFASCSPCNRPSPACTCSYGLYQYAPSKGRGSARLYNGNCRIPSRSSNAIPAAIQSRLYFCFATWQIYPSSRWCARNFSKFHNFLSSC